MQTKLTSEEVESLNRQWAKRPTPELLAWAWERFGSRAAVGTSFQGAGLVILHLAKQHGLGFPAFTLDTGLLFPETVALKRRLEEFLEIRIEVLEPDLTVEQQAAAYGPALWRRDPDLCCTFRKVLPLQNKLDELDCWITGLRRDQSDHRAGTQLIELYGRNGEGNSELVKLNPLATWSRQQVWDYVREHRIPYNPLSDRGYRSIGCQPCTVATGAGGNPRAGRWTGFQKSECGIHTFLARKGD